MVLVEVAPDVWLDPDAVVAIYPGMANGSSTVVLAAGPPGSMTVKAEPADIVGRLAEAAGVH